MNARVIMKLLKRLLGKQLPKKAKDTIPGVRTGVQQDIFEAGAAGDRKAEILARVNQMQRGIGPDSGLQSGMQRMQSQAYSELNQPGSGNIRAMFTRGGTPRSRALDPQTGRYRPDPGSFNEMTLDRGFAEFLRFKLPRGMNWKNVPPRQKEALLREYRQVSKKPTMAQVDYETRSDY